LLSIHEGACLCGEVRFQVKGEPLRTFACHCRYCQKLTGSSFYAEAMFPIEAVEIRGKLSVYGHRSETSGKLVYAHFCQHCGTTVSLTFERWPEFRGVSRGCFDDPNWVEISSHIWTESAQTGVVLPENTDCFFQARASLNGEPAEAIRYTAPQHAKLRC
jgi:hypothetical protein